MKKIFKWLLGSTLLILFSFALWVWSRPANEFNTDKVRSLIQSSGPEKFRAEALAMKEFRDKDGRVDSKNWPRVVREIDPMFVEVTAEGIYICLQSMWVSFSGVFLPFTEDFVDQDKGEPDYEKQFKGIWFYFSPG